MIRKIDFFAQCTILAAAVLAAIASLFEGGYFYGALFLLLPLGARQMASAVVISFFSKMPEAKMKLKNYWILSIGCIAMLFGAFLFRDGDSNDVTLVLVTVALSCSFLAAVYYLYLYKKEFLHGKPIEENSSIGSV